MCMNKSNLNMEYDKNEGCFVGYGYKQLTHHIPVNIRKRGDKAILDYLTKKYSEYKHLQAGWMEARGAMSLYGSKSKFKRDTKEYDSNGGSYWPGFHIFLKEQDARSYYHDGIVVKVKYAEVTDFGTNDTDNDEGEGPCVIARYMKFIEVVEYPEDFFEEEE